VQTDCLDPGQSFDHLVEYGPRPFDEPGVDLFDKVMPTSS
jgi:hypothetical protein